MLEIDTVIKNRKREEIKLGIGAEVGRDGNRHSGNGAAKSRSERLDIGAEITTPEGRFWPAGQSVGRAIRVCGADLGGQVKARTGRSGIFWIKNRLMRDRSERLRWGWIKVGRPQKLTRWIAGQ